jgi:hypothetical protein
MMLNTFILDFLNDASLPAAAWTICVSRFDYQCKNTIYSLLIYKKYILVLFFRHFHSVDAQSGRRVIPLFGVPKAVASFGISKGTLITLPGVNGWHRSSENRLSRAETMVHHGNRQRA